MAGFRRGSTDYSLVLGINKPVGVTSHDCVNRVRHIFGEKRVGHAGTLDPFASGVLPILVGPATKLMPFFNGFDKEYVAGIKFGAATNTDDLDGDIISTGIIKDELFDEAFADRVLADFLGKRMQMPPKFSAIKIGGVKSYDAARQGIDLELRERSVTIKEASLLSIEKDYDGNFGPVWFVNFKVSSGTYIRSIARDIGNAVGVPAHLRCLTRMKVAGLCLDECSTFDEIATKKERALIDPITTLDTNACMVDDIVKTKIKNGCTLSVSDIKACEFQNIYTNEDIKSNDLYMCSETELLAIYKFNAEKHGFSPECVFAKGVRRD